MSYPIRPVTANLIDSVFTGAELRPATIVDFGIDSPVHYAALAGALLSGRIEPRELDAALGNGPMLSELGCV